MIHQQLYNELQEHNDFFDMIVDMIPTKLLIAEKNTDSFNPKSRYMKNAGADSKDQRKAAAKLAKRRKLDPNENLSNTEIKKELEMDGSGVSASDIPKPIKKTTPLPANASRIEALRAKLQAKIAQKQAGRPSRSPNEVSRRVARRAEKKKRQEEAAKRKKNTQTEVPNTASAAINVVSPMASKNTVDISALDYGRISGLQQNDRPVLDFKNNPKNLKKIIADAEAKRQKLEELKKGSLEEKEKASQMQWTDTFKEADGQRVKDDPSKLKKVLKRKEAKKKKSEKAWKSRMETAHKAVKERQKIRTHNLNARKKGGVIGANLSKKRIVTEEDVGKKLERQRAGFEGRKKGFLNSPKN